MSNPQGLATHGLFGFIRSVLKLLKEVGAEHVVAVYDGPDNKKQRLEIYEKYKANRVKEMHADLPEQIALSKTFCELVGIPHIEVGGVEADDTMGSIALWAAEQGSEVYLCTSDKDFCQLVNDQIFVLNPWKDNLIIDAKKVEEIYGIRPNQIVDYLAIVGDSSDNIPGLSGFGPKTAAPLLQEFGTLETILANPDQIKGAKKQATLREEAEIALLSKRLATIHTSVDFPKEPACFTLRAPERAPLKAFYQEMGFDSLARELDKETLGGAVQELTSYHLVETESDLDRLVVLLSRSKEIAFDIVATNLHPLRAQPVGIGFCIQEKEAYYVPLNGILPQPKVLEALKPLFENPDLAFFAHNAKYDLHVLSNVGIAISNLSFDTMLASYILHSAGRKHTLEHLVLQYFDKAKTPLKQLVGSGKKELTLDLVPQTEMSAYCCDEVDFTFRLKQLLANLLKARNLESLLYGLELPLTRVLATMERSGVFLDLAQIKTVSEEVGAELKISEAEIYALAGTEFNINSPKQLSTVLFETLDIKPLKKTTTGHSTNADVLEQLAVDYPIAQKILVYRSLEKLRSTYLDVLPQEINPATQRIHPTFSQSVAATGRLACQDPNLQNIPVRTVQGRKIRGAFRPQRPGWSYLAADYSQIELRLLAHLSEDPELLKAFELGEDIHAYTASLVFDTPLDLVSKTQRQNAKAINFGIIYGQQAYGLSQELGIEVKEAYAFIEAYFKRYPKVLEFIMLCTETAKKTGKSVTMIGRERELPEIHSTNAIIRSAAERLAINTPLQGSAADLIKLAMLEIDALLTKNKMNALMILQIHDELIFEVPDFELEPLKILVKKAMEGAFSLKIPLVVDLNVGKNWAEI